MGFLSRLLGQNKARKKRHDKDPINKGATSIEAELAFLCGVNSHSEYPLLRVGYSPTSRYPATDFTPWIADKLAEQSFKDIAYLLTQLTSANPGLGTGSEYWENETRKLYNLNLRNIIECDDDKAFLDLRAALFPYILHGSLDGFMLVDHVDFLARSTSPYAFSVCHLGEKIKAANQFIRKMRKETKEHSTAWTKYPLLRVKDLSNIQNSAPPASDLRAKLREVSIGARQLFFGTLKDGSGKGHWIARPYGINEREAETELVEIGLGQLRSDPSLTLMTYRKAELLEALDGHPVKQGWNKKSIAKYMQENAPEIIARLVEGKEVFDLQDQVTEEGAILADWANKTKILLAIALGFIQ